MLPSGNDAAALLAIFFGEFQEKDCKIKKDIWEWSEAKINKNTALNVFIKEMNS